MAVYDFQINILNKYDGTNSSKINYSKNALNYYYSNNTLYMNNYYLKNENIQLHDGDILNVEINIKISDIPDDITNVIIDIHHPWSGSGSGYTSVVPLIYGHETSQKIPEIISGIKLGATIRVSGTLERKTNPSSGLEILYNQDSYNFQISKVSKSIKINNKNVSSLTINNDINKIEINGHIYSWGKDILITEDEVKEHINKNIVWAKAVLPAHDIFIGSDEYTAINRSSSSYFFVTINGYTWPTNDLTISNSTIITFNDDVNGLGTSGTFFYLGDGNNYASSHKKIQVYTNSFAGKYFLKGTTWLFKNGEDPVQLNGNINDITGTIDTTKKIKGFDITYSKENNIKDGETIATTVIFDSSISDTLNGGTTDIVFSGIIINNSNKIITDKEITDYIDANINWNGISGNLDVTKWPYIGTDLYVPNLHITKNVDVIYTVQAKSGFTINGASSYKITYSATGPLVTADYTITENDYKTMDISGSDISIHDYTGTAIPSNFKGSLILFFKKDLILRNYNIIIWMYPGSNTFSYVTPGYHSIDFNIKTGESWYFKSGEAPVKI